MRKKGVTLKSMAHPITPTSLEQIEVEIDTDSLGYQIETLHSNLGDISSQIDLLIDKLKPLLSLPDEKATAPDIQGSDANYVHMLMHANYRASELAYNLELARMSLRI